MISAANLLVALAMGLNLMALVSRRIPSIIRAAAAQGIVVGVLPVLLLKNASGLALTVAMATVIIKGFVVPGLLRRALLRASIDREVLPLIGFIPSLLIGALATVGAVALGLQLPLMPQHVELLLVPGALATLVAGFLLLIGRSKAITQVCGYLILENGIYLFGLLLLESTPLLVEAGILLDLTVGVFVTGIIVDHIRREFDTLDTRKLTGLHE